MTADCDGVSEPLGWAVSPARFRPGLRVYSQKGINGIPMRVTRLPNRQPRSQATALPNLTERVRRRWIPRATRAARQRLELQR